jgi:hypothetical protein
VRPRLSLVVAPRLSFSPSIAINVDASQRTWLHRTAVQREVMTVRGDSGRASAESSDPRSPWAARNARVVVDRVTAIERVMRRVHQRIDAQVSREVTTRVVARTDRVEMRQATGRSLVLASPAVAVAARARNAAVVPEMGSPMPMSMQARMSANPCGARDAAPPPVNVDRIADQVLQQLDRRVSAWRERMGRS